MSEESGMTSIRTEELSELPESSTGSVQPVRGPAVRACDEETEFESHIAPAADPRGRRSTQNTVLQVVLERVVSVWSVPRYAIELYLSRRVHTLHIA